MSQLALCVHAHFCQPPRENPFTGAVSLEPGAEPFDNHIARVHGECYKPNADLGNFGMISFDFCPALANCIETAFPATHQQIVDSAQHYERAFGVGNALAQPYYHCILPLQPYRDKVTQIAWGIADFRHRFGYRPQGMWLPEMAVDLETLVALEEQGITYTLLSPDQVRWPNGDWVDAGSAFYVRLPRNHRITVFLRNAQMSNRLSFDPNLAEDARAYADWCHSVVSSGPGLHIIATEGETFGHHHQNRQYLLASLLRSEASRVGFGITTPGAYLRSHAARDEVMVQENTTWTCAHGTSRWTIGCACTPGDQAWKARLHTAMDRLAGGINALYQAECRGIIDNPWALRDSYVNVLLGRIDTASLLQQFASHAIPTQATLCLSRLLDAQRYCLAMYTSHGWHFEDLNRFETRSNIGYAAMAIEQVKRATQVDLAPDFRDDLSTVKSWITDETGRDLFDYIVTQRKI